MSDFYSAVNGSDLAVDDLSYLSKGQSAKQLYNSAVLTEKTITSNGTYNASSDQADGYSKVTVNVPSSSPTLITKNITSNGTYNASSDQADGYSSVTVNIPADLFDVTADTVYDYGLKLYKNGNISYISGCIGTDAAADTLVLHYPDTVTLPTSEKYAVAIDTAPAAVVSSSVSVSNTNHTVTITFASSLTSDTLYYVSVVCK